MPAKRAARGARSKKKIETSEKNTLYVNNLYEKIAQDGESSASYCDDVFSISSSRSLIRCNCFADLKNALRLMFSRYGNILDIVSRRTYKLRGQAWVVFERAEDAAVAKEELEGFPFMNKPMVCHETI